MNINGYIVSNNDKQAFDLFGKESTCPKDVTEKLDKAKGKDIELFLNSPGGSVFAGSEIYTMLKSYQGNVIVKITGIAASIASVIAMGADKVLISPTSQIMIHNSSSIASGDYRVMEHTSKVLKNTNEAIANAYILKTGLSREKLFRMMDNETWFTAQQAVDYNLADGILFDSKQEAENRLQQLKDKPLQNAQQELNKLKNRGIANVR